MAAFSENISQIVRYLSKLRRTCAFSSTCTQKMVIVGNLLGKSSYRSASRPGTAFSTTLHVHPAKSQISLCICVIWSEYSLCVLRITKDPSHLHAATGDSDQTAQMRRRSVIAGRTCNLVGSAMARLICLYNFS